MRIHDQPRRLLKLTSLCLVLASAWTVRTIFNPLIEIAKMDLHLDDLQVGFAQGLALSMPAALLAIPVGRLIDTRNRIALLLSIAVVTMLGTSATAFVTSVSDLIVYRIFAGLGMMEEAIVLSLAADLFPPEQRGKVTAAILVAEYGGTALGFAMADWLLPLAQEFAWLANGAPWRAILLTAGIGGLLLALPLIWLEEPPRQERAAEQMRASIGQGFRALGQYARLLLPLFVAQIAMMCAMNAANVWAASIFSRTFALDQAQAGDRLAIAFLVPPLLGAILAGILVDRSSTYRGAIGIAIAATGLTIIGAAFSIAPTATAAMILLCLLAAGQAAALISSSAVGIVAIPNELRGLWFGITVTGGTLLGSATAPPLVAWMAGFLSGPQALPTALSILLFVTGLLAFAAFAAVLVFDGHRSHPNA